MMEKMKQHYLQIGPRRFVLGTILLLIVLDILNTIYLRLYWVKKDLTTQMVLRMMEQKGYTIEDFSRETILEMKGFLDNTFYFFLFLVLINNFFFYFFYARKKLWAQGYVLFYTLTAAIFSVSFIVDDVGLGWGWATYNFLTIPLYAYLYFGVKLLKHETTDIIPAHEKKGQ